MFDSETLGKSIFFTGKIVHLSPSPEGMIVTFDQEVCDVRCRNRARKGEMPDHIIVEWRNRGMYPLFSKLDVFSTK